MKFSMRNRKFYLIIFTYHLTVIVILQNDAKNYKNVVLSLTLFVLTLLPHTYYYMTPFFFVLIIDYNDSFFQSVKKQCI